MEGRTIVIYASRTGNTRRVAQAIAEAVGGEMWDVRTGAPLELSQVGFLFVGDGVYFGRPSGAMVRFVRGLPRAEGLPAAVFGTYGAQPKQLAALAKALVAKGVRVVDRFSCPGRDWFVGGLLHRGRPSVDDLRAAQEFARRVGG
ncbi:MAG: flavodoxin family protein [Candidatus Bipolaricaulota bacterium]